MPFWENLGMQAASQVAGGLIGGAFGLWNDHRQLQQQEKLQKLQIAGQKEMADYQQQKQMKMWEATNYPAQVEQLTKAGLNPAVMYGKGGGGGTTTGSASGNVTGAQAPSGGGEMSAQSAQMMGVQLMDAQMKALQGQANKANAEADQIRGVGKDVMEQQANVLNQTFQNLKQDHTVKLIDISLKRIEEYQKLNTKEDVINKIKAEAESAMANAKIVGVEKKIAEATVNDQIKIIQQKSINAVLQNILTQAQTTNVNTDTQLKRDQMKQITNTIMLNWDKLENDKKETFIKQQLMEWDTDMPTQLLLRGVQSIGGILGGALKKGPQSTYNQYGDSYKGTFNQ